MESQKLYYMVYTQNEKVWINADGNDITTGVLSFYDLREDGSKLYTVAFGAGYWSYFYEADVETGDSINQQIPFWKRHPHQITKNYTQHDTRSGLPAR